MRQDEPVVAVVLASANLAALLAEVIDDVRGQTRRPNCRVVSVPDETSLPSGGVPDDVTVVSGARGAAAQRNAGITAAVEADLGFFFNDDAVLRRDYIERGVEVFTARPGVAGFTGRVLLDGATGVEIGRPGAMASGGGDSRRKADPPVFRALFAHQQAQQRVPVDGSDDWDRDVTRHRWPAKDSLASPASPLAPL